MARWLDKILAAGVNETIEQVASLAEKHTGKKERDIAIAQLLATQANAQLDLIKEELGVALAYPDYKAGLQAILAAED